MSAMPGGRFGEAKIVGRGQVSLPAQGLRSPGWWIGDHLVVERQGDDTLVLRRRPASWIDALAGGLTGVFGNTAQNVAFVRGERASWGE